MRRILPRAAFKEQHQETGCLHTDLFVQRFELITNVCNVQSSLIIRFSAAIFETIVTYRSIFYLIFNLLIVNVIYD